MVYIKLGNLTDLPIKLPKLSQQKEIVATLDKANELIALRKKQLQELDALAEAVFYDMFGDPVKNEMGWEMKRLGELGKWKSGGTPSRTETSYFQGNIPWVTSGELNSMYIEDSIEKITTEAINNSNAKVINAGSLLLGMYDSAALKSSIIRKSMACNQAIAYSHLNKDICDVVYVYYIIQMNKEIYKKEQRGIRQKNLNLSMIKAISISYPPLPLQTRFASIIEKIEEQKTQVRKALQESEDLFQRLMQDLFKPD